jgi:hypothetical protein
MPRNRQLTLNFRISGKGPETRKEEVLRIDWMWFSMNAMAEIIHSLTLAHTGNVRIGDKNEAAGAADLKLWHTRSVWT